MRGTMSDRHYYELAIFNIEVDDELVPFEIDGRNFSQNAGSSSRTGVELAIVSNVTDRLQTSLTYSYGDYKFDDFRVISFDEDGVPTVEDDFSGNTIPGTVEHLLFGELAYTHPSGWYGVLDAIYVGEQFANNSNSVKVDSYTVANLRLGLERTVGSSIVSPFIGINNLFDESYNTDIRINAFGGRYFEPAPELNVYAGVSVNFDLR